MMSTMQHPRRSKRRPLRRITDADREALKLLYTPPRSHGQDDKLKLVNDWLPLLPNVNRSDDAMTAFRKDGSE